MTVLHNGILIQNHFELAGCDGPAAGGVGDGRRPPPVSYRPDDHTVGIQGFSVDFLLQPEPPSDGRIAKSRGGADPFFGLHGV